MGEPKSEDEVIREFQAKRDRLQTTWNKITEFAAESTEHEMVIQALEPMDKGRKCFRLVGDVLVERTVGETLPAVEKNKQNIDTTIAALQKQLEAQKKDLTDFQTKYKIRVRSGNERKDADEEKPTGSKPGAQGVLVSKS